MRSRISRPEERPVHEAIVRRPFYLGRTEVTQAQWVATMGAHEFDVPGVDHPAENISVPEIRTFLERTDFSLPTEVEWEWAVRAGAEPPEAFELPTVAWFRENAGGTPHPVATRAPQ